MSDASFAGAPVAATIARIGLAARASDEAGFHALRAFAIERAQAASGQVWTDYNLHDPGVTILEAVCFALTDLVYQADFPVADLLCGPNGEIDFARQALFPPQTIFPCRATTFADYRRVLLDRLPFLRDARLKVAPHPAGGGLFQLNLLMPDAPAPSWDDCLEQARVAFRYLRGLGEDLDGVSQIQVRDCSLRLECTVWGPRDPADVLAEIYDVCATALAPPLVARGVEDLRDAGRSLEQIFTGPTVVAGFIDEDALSGPGTDRSKPDAKPKDELSLNNLRTLLLQIDGVAAVTRLSLKIEPDGDDHVRLLQWPGDEWVPRLRTPMPLGPDQTLPSESADIKLVQMKRGSAVVTVDQVDVAASYADIRAGRDSGRRPDTSGAAGVHLLKGVPHPPMPYDSLQNLLPPLYRIGLRRPADEIAPMAALPGAASPAAASVQGELDRQARHWGPKDARLAQLKAYLALFDQILANATAQVRHVRDLFTPEGPLAKSYWREVVDNRSIPDIEAFYAGRAPAEVADQVYRRYDDAVDRLNRLLDYLLSLYGEQYAQNTQRQFLGHLDSVEQSRLLLDNKAAFLRKIDVLTRDRAEGFDYGVELWGEADHTPGLQRRMALLLGFTNPRARKLSIHPALHAAATASLTEQDTADDGPADPLEWPAGDSSKPAADAALADASDGLPIRARGLSIATLFALAVDRQNYAWRPHGQGSGGVLRLGRGSRGSLALGAFESQQEAGRLANALRNRMLALTEACEGLHMVEHILLRPRAHARAWRAFAYALRVTLILPGWTVRTTRQDFRDFASETGEINSPAHVAVDCLWLDMAEMRRFETLYEQWMDLLRAHRDAAPDPALDAAAWAVRQLIVKGLREQHRRLRRARPLNAD